MHLSYLHQSLHKLCCVHLWHCQRLIPATLIISLVPTLRACPPLFGVLLRIFLLVCLWLHFLPVLFLLIRVVLSLCVNLFHRVLFLTPSQPTYSSSFHHLSYCVSAVLEQHSDQLQSLSWKRDGSLLASSCKVRTMCTEPDVYGND